MTKLSEFGLFNGKQSLFIHFMFTIFRSCRHAVIASYFGDSEPKVHTCTILGTCSKLLVGGFLLWQFNFYLYGRTHVEITPHWKSTFTLPLRIIAPTPPLPIAWPKSLIAWSRDFLRNRSSRMSASCFILMLKDAACRAHIRLYDKLLRLGKIHRYNLLRPNHTKAMYFLKLFR